MTIKKHLEMLKQLNQLGGYKGDFVRQEYATFLQECLAVSSQQGKEMLYYAMQLVARAFVDGHADHEIDVLIRMSDGVYEHYMDIPPEIEEMRQLSAAWLEIAAVAKERNMWLVIEVNESDEKYQKIRIADIKRQIEWYNGDVSIAGISPTPSVFSTEQWASRRIMNTAEVLGL